MFPGHAVTVKWLTFVLLLTSLL